MSSFVSVVVWTGAAAFCAVGFPRPAVANDSTMTMGAGGIELTVSKDVAMESEDLWISSGLIRVSYKFRNSGPEDVSTKVAFPLPWITECDGGCEFDQPLSVGPNPMKFKLKVDGEPKPFKTERKKSRRDRHGYVNVRIMHYWEQVFPKDRVVTIEHEYHPASGGSFIGYSTNPKRDYPELVKNYCIDVKSLKPLMRKLKRADHDVWYREVEYILTTGANWKGPIGKFKLTLDKEIPNGVVATCFPDLQPASDTTLELVRENFVPTTNLKILFIHW
jgi:hypothetical protein